MSFTCQFSFGVSISYYSLPDHFFVMTGNSQYKSEGFLIAYVKFVATTLGFTDTHRLLFLSAMLIQLKSKYHHEQNKTPKENWQVNDIFNH
jgi:hypothetical protein